MNSDTDTTDVLVVDDDPSIRKMLRELLADAGYSVYEAPDGIRGLERLRTHPTPLVVLLDWQMPGMDGLAVLHAVASDTLTAHRHAVILLTGRDDTSRQQSAFPPGISVTVLGKPFEAGALLDAVAQAARRLAP